MPRYWVRTRRGGGVGGELIVGVGEIGVFPVVQRQHGLELLLDFDFHLGNDLVEEGHVLAGLLAQHISTVPCT